MSCSEIMHQQDNCCIIFNPSSAAPIKFSSLPLPGSFLTLEVLRHAAALKNCNTFAGSLLLHTCLHAPLVAAPVLCHRSLQPPTAAAAHAAVRCTSCAFSAAGACVSRGPHAAAAGDVVAWQPQGQAGRTSAGGCGVLQWLSKGCRVTLVKVLFEFLASSAGLSMCKRLL